MLAPDLIRAAFANVLWKKRRRGDFTGGEARAMLADFRRFALITTPAEPLVEAAADLADRLARSVYDGLYLALAERTGCRLVTADRRFLFTPRLTVRLFWAPG